GIVDDGGPEGGRAGVGGIVEAQPARIVDGGDAQRRAVVEAQVGARAVGDERLPGIRAVVEAGAAAGAGVDDGDAAEGRRILEAGGAAGGGGDAGQAAGVGV